MDGAETYLNRLFTRICWPGSKAHFIFGSLRRIKDFRQSLYGRGAEVSIAGIVNMLAKSWKPPMISDGFQVSPVQEMVFEQAEAPLQVTDESFGRWDDFPTWLEPPS